MKITKEVLDDLTRQAKENERLRMNRDMRTTPMDASQRMLNALEPGTVLPIHRHRTTTETIVLLRGAARQYLYDDNGNVTATVTMRAGSDCPGMSVEKGQWHRLESLESGTVIFESKDGAFTPLQPEDIFESAPKERKTINLCLAHMSESGAEMKYIKEAFDTDWVVPLGPNVNAFEKDLEAFVGNKRKVVALASGTSAVHLALLALGIGPGDEVCVQSFTFCASSHPITYVGATPVFIGPEPDTWNMDPDLLEAAIVDRYAKTGKYPKAIIPVALYGMPYDITRIMAIADKYGIPVVEDAAEGFGSRFDGGVLGSFGRFGVLSFNGNKMITTSGGGALVCANPEDASRVMWYATQARDGYPYYEHSAIGYNYRMSNICAGIGRGQMTVADEHIAHHRHVQKLYEELLANVPGLKMHSQPADKRYDSNYWLCTATLDPSVSVVGQENAYKEVVKTAIGGAAGVIKIVDSPVTDCQPNENIEALRMYMLSHKVEARPLWKPMHKQPVYAGMPVYTNGVEEAMFKVGFCLPAGPSVSDDDVRYIVDCIKESIE